MSNFIYLVVGLSAGIILGVVTTSLIQANHIQAKNDPYNAEWEDLVRRYHKSRAPHPMDHRWRSRPDGWGKS